MEQLVSKLVEESAYWLPRLGGVVLITTGFYLLVKLVRGAILRSCKRLHIDAHLATLLARTSRVTLVVLGAVTALGTLGVNVSALVAGLGLIGFALGFALKDTVANLLSGVMILLYQPFKLGNTIRISGYEGCVISIDLRYTELSHQGCKILIPNSKLFTDPITVVDVESDTPSV